MMALSDPRNGTFLRSYRTGARVAGLFGIPAAKAGRFAHYNLYDIDSGRLLNRLWPLWTAPSDAEVCGLFEQAATGLGRKASPNPVDEGQRPGPLRSSP